MLQGNKLFAGFGLPGSRAYRAAKGSVQECREHRWRLRPFLRNFTAKVIKYILKNEHILTFFQKMEEWS